MLEDEAIAQNIMKCRLCLNASEEEMHDLFDYTDEYETNTELLKLSEKVEYCSGVRIRDSAEMPTKICVNCKEMTNIWFKFRQMCINSQIYLETLSSEDIGSVQLSRDDNGSYWEYAVEDLQTFRAKARKSYAGLVVRISAEETDALQESDAITATNNDNNAYDSPDEMKIRKEARETTLMNLRRKLELKCAKRSHDFKKFYRPRSPTSFMCYICGNIYNKKSTFHHHLSMHSGVKEHECELCGRAFRLKGALKSHMRRHTGEKPYKCSHCDRHFADRSDRHRHERVHTNSRPYACMICNKRFTYSALLKRHLKLHSDVRDYHCDVCDKSFVMQDKLKAHLLTITHKQKEQSLSLLE